MRKALNENPMVQLAVIGGMVVVAAFLLFTNVVRKDDPAATDAASAGDPATEAASAAPAAPAATETAAPSAPAPTGAVDPATGTPAEPVTPAPSSADGLLPTKGLPEDVLVAFARNKVIVLAVVDPKAISDRQVRDFTRPLSSRDDVETFVVDVKDIAEYSRITSGVAVSRTPAVVVVRPRKLTGNVPTAEVIYGFRAERSIEQAVDDALYRGAEITAAP